MKPSDSRRGFTLLELLMAIMIGALLMVAASTFVFSMGELWGRGGEERLFDRHVRGVTRFMDGLLRGAVAAADANGEVAAVWWAEPIGSEYTDEELLTFELQEGPGVLVWPGEALPNVVCAFQLDRDDGLFLLWKSLLEVDYEDASPRRTRLSPFVDKIEYIYYDSESDPPEWEQESEPMTDSAGVPMLPSRLQISFVYGDETRVVDLVLPTTSVGVPLY
jgi:prepilin-type N-terminal cleavage/methylation domain-containing protein